MNKRSKKAWIENVAWGLVVSMSVLQLTGTALWSQAYAQNTGQAQCWIRRADGPVRITDCGACSSGGCAMPAYRTFAFDICAPASSGHVVCSPSTYKSVPVGTKRLCGPKYNTAKLILGMGSGVVAAIVGACGTVCAGTGPLFVPCMNTCAASSPAWLTVVGGASAGNLGVRLTCLAVEECSPVGDAIPVYEPFYDLWVPGCVTGS